RSSIPTLPQLLGAHGYGTFTLAANGFISPEMGLVQGFDAATWGDWWERYLRLPTRTLPPRALNFPPTQRLPNGPGWGRLESKAWYAHRFPWVIDATTRFVQQLRYPTDARRLAVSPWIEATLDRWLRTQPAEKPVFAFVNLMEGHEPYLTDPETVHGLRNWFRTANVRMDKTSVITGDWKPTEEESRRLRRLYRDMIRFIDRRIAGLVAALRSNDRWSNTVLVLTSDHGQSFGEHGCMFHGQKLWDPLVRIPLWLRLPDGGYAGTRAEGWASLVDVAPTVLELAHLPNGHFPSAVPLTQLIDRPRPTPVYAMGDGIHQKTHVKKFADPAVIARWERCYVAAYDGDDKVIIDLTDDAVQAFDIARDPGEARDLWPLADDRLASVVAGARRVGQQLLKKATGETSPEVEERLRSWGYL
ncbi:MAG: sulfatase-like hydrolase/transferase, partial [Thermoplasmata archaeon]|nr:sulfatase-like hydrolase/transferase [Thermoplasmata archaeon]